MAKEAEEEGVGQTPGRVVAPEMVEVTSEVMEVVPVVVGIASEVAEVAPEIQVEGGATGLETRGEEQPQGGLAPQRGGVRPKYSIYHAPTVSGRLEGEEGPARMAADLLLGVVDEGAVRSAARFYETELLRGLCSAQMEATTLAGALLRKAAAAKAKWEETKVQLASFKKKSAGWKKAARSACTRGGGRGSKGEENGSVGDCAA
ncbi:hypothetical protein CsSME_00000377 [Camellia sinensis var. sinensis]